MNSSNVPLAKHEKRFVVGCIAVMLFAWTASFVVFDRALVSREQTFTSATVSDHAPLGVYIDVLAIDPVRESMTLRLDIATGSGPNGTQYFAALHRAIALGVSDGETEQTYRFERDTPVSSRDFVASLLGNVAVYPFDRYATRVVTMAHDYSRKGKSLFVPLRLTMWGGVSGWVVRPSQVRSTVKNTEIALALSISRPAPLVFFACVLYGIMILMAASAIVIGTLIFLGIRRVEPTLVSALVAMAFALPALRNLLPGAPPLGVLADVAIVLWAELAVAIGLTLIVAAWARRGSK